MSISFETVQQIKKPARRMMACDMCRECGYSTGKRWKLGDICPSCGTPLTERGVYNLYQIIQKLEKMEEEKE